MEKKNDSSKRDAILKELESIHEYLNDEPSSATDEKTSEGNNDMSTDIPVLTDAVPLDEQEEDFDSAQSQAHEAIQSETDAADEKSLMDAYRNELGLEPSASAMEETETASTDTLLAPPKQSALATDAEIRSESKNEVVGIQAEIAIEEPEEYLGNPDDDSDNLLIIDEDDEEPDAVDMALGDLPSQTSIFDAITDEILDNQSKSQNSSKQSEDKAKDEQISRELKQTRQAMQTGENPFLPPHIRKQLGQHRGVNSELQKLSEDTIAQSNLFKGKAKKPGTLLAQRTIDLSEEDMHQLIDETIAEFMPKIEYSLKLKLKNKFSESK